MKFTNISSEWNPKLSGSHYVGEVQTTSSQLKRAFGSPHIIEPAALDGKTRVEWTIEWEDGALCTIYDWKCSPIPVHLVDEWHVGGFSKEVVDRVEKELERVTQQERA